MTRTGRTLGSSLEPEGGKCPHHLPKSEETAEKGRKGTTAMTLLKALPLGPATPIDSHAIGNTTEIVLQIQLGVGDGLSYQYVCLLQVSWANSSLADEEYMVSPRQYMNVLDHCLHSLDSANDSQT